MDEQTKDQPDGMSLNEINDFFVRESRKFAEALNLDIMGEKSALDLINPNDHDSADKIEAIFEEHLLRLETLKSIALARNKKARSNMGLEE